MGVQAHKPRSHSGRNLLGGRAVLCLDFTLPRLNTIFDRTKEHLVAFIEIAFVSILARRLKRLAIDEVSD